MPVDVCCVTSDSELEQIIALQTANLREIVGEVEAEKEGYVTAVYTLEYMKKMNACKATVVAKAGGKVIGYVLVMTREIAVQHRLCASLVELLKTIPVAKTSPTVLDEVSYVFCGQLCVAQGYRGLGVAPRMYNHFYNQYHNEFNYCITDVAYDNVRSIKAHEKSGFKICASVNHDGVGFAVVVWDWNNNSDHTDDR